MDDFLYKVANWSLKTSNLNRDLTDEFVSIPSFPIPIHYNLVFHIVSHRISYDLRHVFSNSITLVFQQRHAQMDLLVVVDLLRGEV